MFGKVVVAVVVALSNTTVLLSYFLRRRNIAVLSKMTDLSDRWCLSVPFPKTSKHTSP